MRNFIGVFIFFGAFFDAQPSRAILTTHAVCESILKQAMESKVNSANDPKTTEALDELRQFLNFSLRSEFGHMADDALLPSMENVRAGSESSRVAKEKVAQRIKGIIQYQESKFRGPEFQEIASSEDKKIFAVTLEGEEIPPFITGVKVKQQIANQNNVYDKFFGEDGRVDFVESGSNLFYFYFVTKGIANILTGITTVDENVFGAIGSIVWYQLFGGATFAKEVIKEKIFGRQAYFSRFLKEIETAYNDGRAGLWNYMSFDMYLPTVNQETLFNLRSPRFVIDMDKYNRHPYFARKYTSMALADKFKNGDLKFRWIGVDLLFQNDERSDTSKLIIVVRTQLKKPKIPIRSSNKQGQRERSLAPGMEPDLI